MADRELLLLAERGGLKTDDLLWRPGFEFLEAGSRGLRSRGTCSEPIPVHPAAMDEANDSARHRHRPPSRRREKPSLRARLLKELKSFLIMFAYLWLVFSVFLLHEWTVLASHQISFRFYGLAVVNALILAKIMLIAEAFAICQPLRGQAADLSHRLTSRLRSPRC